MRAMRLHAAGSALRADAVELREPGPGEVLLRVKACGVCRDGELAAARSLGLYGFGKAGA